MRKFLSTDEIAYIDGHVPYTQRLKGGDGMKTFISAKDRYIVKPADSYAATGVYAGKDFSQEAWGELLRKIMKENYLIQEYCPPALSENITYDAEGRAQLEKFHNLTGLFVYNQKLAGVYSRAGRNTIIADQNGGYTMSSVYLE